MCVSESAIFIQKCAAKASEILKNTIVPKKKGVHQQLNGGSAEWRLWMIIKKSNSEEFPGGC